MNRTPELEIKDIDVPQDQMPCCPLCDNPIFGGCAVAVGRVKAHGEVAFALVHETCIEDGG